MSSGNRFPKCFVQTLHDVFSAAHPNFKRVVRSVRRAARRKEAAVHLEPLPLYFPRCMPAAGPAGVRSPAHGPRNGARLDGAPPTAALKDTCVSARATRPGAAGIYPGGSIPEGRAASGGGAQNKRTSLRMSFCSGAGNVTRTHDLLITNEELFVLPSFVHFRKPLRRKACGDFIVCLVSPRNAHYGQNKPQINPQTNGKNAPHLNTVQ